MTTERKLGLRFLDAFRSSLVGACLLVAAGCSVPPPSPDASVPVAPDMACVVGTAGDQLTLSLADCDDTKRVQVECGKPPKGTVSLLNPPSVGCSPIEPGAKYVTEVNWSGGSSIKEVIISFGDGAFYRYSPSAVEAASGKVAVPICPGRYACSGQSGCFSLICFTQIVRSDGVIGEPVPQTIILDCSNGKGCSCPDMATPPDDLATAPDDLANSRSPDLPLPSPDLRAPVDMAVTRD